MKKYISLLIICALLLVTSCQTRVVSQEKPMQSNSLDLYQKYTIQTNDAKVIKMQLLKIEDDKLYGKSKTGEQVVVDKNDIREVKKLDLVSSIGIAVAAIAAVIFVPI